MDYLQTIAFKSPAYDSVAHGDGSKEKLKVIEEQKERLYKNLEGSDSESNNDLKDSNKDKKDDKESKDDEGEKIRMGTYFRGSLFCFAAPHFFGCK